MRVLMVFVDGIGLGRSCSENPFYLADTAQLSELLGGARLVLDSAGFYSDKVVLLSLDATLGVEGLPQSATGQATLFTGCNAAEIAGEHLNGYPNKVLRELLAEQGFFKKLGNLGYKACFANAYRPAFFEMLELGLPGYTYSCSTLVTYFGGVPFFSIADLNEGRAVYMDITGEALQKMGFPVNSITPEEGARRLAAISSHYDFSLFEYFLSDLAGHKGKAAEAFRVVETLDRFLGALVKSLEGSDTIIILTSDHGNLEDLTVRHHTMNPVPLLISSPDQVPASLELKKGDLTGVLPLIEDLLAWGQ